MNRVLLAALLVGLLLLFPVGSVTAVQDGRLLQIEMQQKRAQLLAQAEAEKKRATVEAEAARARLLADKKALQEAVTELRTKNQSLQKEIKAFQEELTVIKVEEKGLQDKLAAIEGEIWELVGSIRVNARELDSRLRQSLQSAFYPDREQAFQAIMGETRFPGMDEIRILTGVIFDEIVKAGQVRLQEASFIDRSGAEKRGRILSVGNFSAAYQLEKETGFLIYSDHSQRLFALSRLPSRRLAKGLKVYMGGDAEAVPVDISRGAALRQLTHKLNLVDQVPKGGPLVWPILGLALLAALIVIERVIYFVRKSVKAEAFAGKVCEQVARQGWTEGIKLCSQQRYKSLSRVLLTGLEARDLNRQDLENVIQEVILNEIPKLERFLSTLGMLAAIAPLLGLLGTVTGMINTFHAITSYGTSNPQLMSGGISEALVTTMLGLMVAIPIMVAHSLLSRKLESMISEMEEKGVMLVNTLFKTRMAE